MAGDFSSLPHVQAGPGVHGASYKMSTRGFSKANQLKWEYFTHNPYVKLNSKYVLKGLPNTTECDTIQAAFQENEVHIIHIRQMTKTYTDETGATTRLIPVWVITTDNSENTETTLKNITGILHFKITIEPLRNKATTVQCMRCQGFGHRAPFCHLTRKCRLCAQSHDTRECPNRHLPLKCAGCGGGHQASSTEWPKVKKHKQQNKRKQTVYCTEQREFPALRETATTPTRPQNPRNSRHPAPSSNANDSNLATLITLLSSPQTQQILKLLATLLLKITSNHNTLNQITNFLTTMINLTP